MTSPPTFSFSYFRCSTAKTPQDVLGYAGSSYYKKPLTHEQVCRYFGVLIKADVYLQYKIELAQNGMVDGGSSILPVSQRLQRLRQFSSNFESAIFDHEDLSAHPDYVLRMRDLRWNVAIPAEASFSDLYSLGGRSDLSLSVFTPGSAQAGTQSNYSILPIGTAGEQGLMITKWAIDGAQDLLVVGEVADAVMIEQRQGRSVVVSHYFPFAFTNRHNDKLDEVFIRFYSLSGSKVTSPTPHPSAALPAVRVVCPPGIPTTIRPLATIVELHISGEYVICEILATRADVQSVSVEVFNWKTGDMISVRKFPRLLTI